MMIKPLFSGPLDIIGDVHGEIDPLRELLGRLGYEVNGRHADGRRLVFVGDLTDRGPDSPSVLELVHSLVANGSAQCILGNHELNLLRGSLKQGNEWFMDPGHRRAQPGHTFSHCKPAPEHLKSVWLDFTASLPVALERDEFRVIHAAWVPGEIEALRREPGGILETYKRFEQQTSQQLEMEGLHRRAEREEAEWGSRPEDSEPGVPLLTALGESDERHQMGNPLRVATSGVERLAGRPFWSSGKWRMCERVNWWDEYEESVPVIVGHYWRQARPLRDLAHASSKPAAFAEVGPTEWVGPLKNVYCVDFSIGARYEERQAGQTSFNTHLAAMRWPERELWFESGKQG